MIAFLTAPAKRSVAPSTLELLVLLGTAALMVVIAVVHFRLWFEGYSNIPTIGPLFLMNGVVSALLAVAVVVLRSPLTLLAAMLFAAATFGGYLLSVTVGLFGFQETYYGSWALAAAAAEVAAVALAATGLGLRWQAVKAVSYRA